MNNIPYVIIKCAMTLDGYLDDTSDKRLILSNKNDFAEVEKVRESCDAVFVGAETVRKDNPRLILQSGKKLTKVTITRSGNLDPKSHFFTIGESEKIVYTSPAIFETLKQKLSNATIVPIITRHPEQSDGPKDSSAKPQNDNMQHILEDLYKRGIRRLLVEGGSTVITQFLKAGFVDELQISIAPLILGEKGATRVIKDGTIQIPISLQLLTIKNFDNIIVLTYKLKK